MSWKAKATRHGKALRIAANAGPWSGTFGFMTPKADEVRSHLNRFHPQPAGRDLTGTPSSNGQLMTSQYVYPQNFDD